MRLGEKGDAPVNVVEPKAALAPGGANSGGPEEIPQGTVASQPLRVTGHPPCEIKMVRLARIELATFSFGG